MATDVAQHKAIKRCRMNELAIVRQRPEWQRLKPLVLDSVSSPITRRVYNMALNEFLAWFRQAPRPGFTKATVSVWRVTLEERRLGSPGSGSLDKSVTEATRGFA